jgi:hypothetical protein
MKMKIAKGGWRPDRERYSYETAELALRLIAQRWPTLELPADAERGSRFLDNGAVLARLESHYTEAEFTACPGLAVDAMLTDAAKADWWYNHEIRYDEHEGYEDEDNEDE